MSYANLVATSYTMTNIKIREKLSTTDLQSIYATMDNTVQFVSTEKERERQLQPEGTDGWTTLYLFQQFVSFFRNNYPSFSHGGWGVVTNMSEWQMMMKED